LLRIWVLNVGHGDSIVLDYTNGTERALGVIDSNRESLSATPPALGLLRELKATQLSFVLLTHPHADHFRGLYSILDSFPVHTFYAYPMHRDFKRLQAAGAKYLDAALKSGSNTIKQQAEEFVRLIVTAERKRTTEQMEWIDLEGPTNRVRPQGFADVTIHAMLPFKKVKGEYYYALDHNRFDALQSPLQNTLSVALDVTYGDHRISLCGDATEGAWYDHRRELQKASERVSFAISKLPHHGSATDCSGNVLDYLFEQGGKYPDLIGLISADGSKHHPSPEVLEALRKRSVKPYCTNLSVVCGNNVQDLISGPGLSPELARLLNSGEVRARNWGGGQPCQGNICVEIPPKGQFVVTRQFNNACAFRGDFDFLGG
jgi:beta-lactamase superfamily II metal-dependent hydrolase